MAKREFRSTAFSCAVKSLRVAAAEVVLQGRCRPPRPAAAGGGFRPFARRGSRQKSPCPGPPASPSPAAASCRPAGSGRRWLAGRRGSAASASSRRWIASRSREGEVQELGQGEERIAPFLARRRQLLAVEVVLQEGFGLLQVAHVHRGPARQQPRPIDGHVAGVLLDALVERLQGLLRLAQREFGLAQIDQGLGVPQAGLVVQVQPQHGGRIAEVVAGKIGAGAVPKLLRILAGRIHARGRPPSRLSPGPAELRAGLLAKLLGPLGRQMLGLLHEVIAPGAIDLRPSTAGPRPWAASARAT